MKISMVYLYDIYAPLLNERQREVLELYYNEDQSLAEISENVGITRQGVRDAIKHGVESLLALERALEFEKKSASIVSLATRIQQSEDINEAHRLAESIIGEI